MENRRASAFLPTAPASCPCVSRSEKHFQYASFAGTLKRMHPLGKRILLTDQAVDIDGALLQQIQRRLDASTARADNADLINYEPSLIDRIELARSFKGRLQNQRAARFE